MPFPLEFIDVMRRTETDLPDLVESDIRDHWPDAGGRSKHDFHQLGQVRQFFSLFSRNRKKGMRLSKEREFEFRKRADHMTCCRVIIGYCRTKRMLLR